MEQIPKAAEIPASDYIIIGGTGDLAKRKIFPAFLWRFIAGQITSDFRFFAAARHVMSINEFADELRPFCEKALESCKDGEKIWQDFLSLISIMPLDVVEGGGGAELAEMLSDKLDAERPIIFYLAIAPTLFASACNTLSQNGLVLPQSRLVVEKPLGDSGKAAREINEQLLEVFDEHQIYRIDHYLGKETVQNLMALRFANALFESQWNNHVVDYVQITVSETVGVGDRASYYDKYGALRDMVQNHLLQLVCLVAMEPPAYFEADQVRDEKLRVLRAIQPVAPENVVRGQYSGGKMNGEEVDGYLQELGHNSNTETYVALKLFIDNWRWAGVPFYVRTGKRLSNRASEIVVTFRSLRHNIFDKRNSKAYRTEPNRLTIRLQPDEGVKLQFISKKPGPGGMRLSPSELNLSYDEAFGERLPEAYERLLMDVARGNQTLFMRLDEVLAAWEIVDPILAMAEESEMHSYPSGSMGPDAAHRLAEKVRQRWIDPVV